MRKTRSEAAGPGLLPHDLDLVQRLSLVLCNVFCATHNTRTAENVSKKYALFEPKQRIFESYKRSRSCIFGGGEL